MSQVLEVVIPKCNPDTNELNPLTECAICVCCLAQNVRFVNLKTCKHTGFLNIFSDSKKIIPNSVICHHCHCLLKKIEVFRRQVAQSILILKKQTLHSKTNKSHHLGICVLESMTVTPNNNNVQKHENEPNNEFNVEVADVKLECDISDMEIDMPLLDIMKQEEDIVENHIMNKEMNPKLVKKEEAEDSSLIRETNIGKLEMLFFTLEELQKERELIKNEEQYLNLPFKCDKCIIGYNRETFLKQHCKQKHDRSKGKYICGVCETVFVSKDMLDPHYKRHFVGYECKPCSRRYIDERSAVIHYKETHVNVDKVPKKNLGNKTTHMDTQCHVSAGGRPPHRFKMALRWGGGGSNQTNATYCVACRTYFRTNIILQQHLKHHSNHVTEADKKFMCDECGARFSRKWDLRGHIIWVHLKKSDHQCPKCLKLFRTSASLQRHIAFVHEKKERPRDKICDHCGKGFTTRNLLQAHIRTHTGERPFKCEQCSATFKQASSLYNHKRLVHNPLKGDTKRKNRKIK